MLILRCAAWGFFTGLLFPTISFAGILANHSSSVHDADGNPATGSFTEQVVNFDNVLDASVNYAVFRANDFETLFPNSGYIPKGSLVYTYQVFSNDPSSTARASSIWLKAGPRALGDTPSWFNTDAIGGEQEPSSAEISFTTAKWFFPDLTANGSQDFSIYPGKSSWGLRFLIRLCSLIFK